MVIFKFFFHHIPSHYFNKIEFIRFLNKYLTFLQKCIEIHFTGTRTHKTNRKFLPSWNCNDQELRIRWQGGLFISQVKQSNNLHCGTIICRKLIYGPNRRNFITKEKESSLMLNLTIPIFIEVLLNHQIGRSEKLSLAFACF